MILTKKKIKYYWTAKENTNFASLKENLVPKPMLMLPNLSKPFEVHGDVCKDFVRVVLM